jgi:hypothetical protein
MPAMPEVVKLNLAAAGEVKRSTWAGFALSRWTSLSGASGKTKLEAARLSTLASIFNRSTEPVRPNDCCPTKT